MKQVLYIGHIGVCGTAMAVHSRNIASLLEKNGYEITFISKHVPKGTDEFPSEDHFKYFYTKQYIKIPKFSAIEWMIEELSGYKIRSLFKKKAKVLHPELVVFYGYSGEKQIIRYCHTHGIKVVIDRTDWFEPDDSLDFFGRFFTKNIADKCIEKYDFLADGVISISKYFYDFYKKNGQKTIWIPPLIEFRPEKKFLDGEKSTIRLVYAGSLGGTKDIIDPVVNALLYRYNSTKIRFVLDLVGVFPKQLDDRFGVHEWDKYGIHAYGRVPHDEAEKIVSESDFSILLRHDKRYAKAGFSTKFSESLMNSVPIICTKVGGADMLINDGFNGFLLENNSDISITTTLDRILRMSPDQLRDMTHEAYLLGVNTFSSNLYQAELANFIGN